MHRAHRHFRHGLLSLLLAAPAMSQTPQRLLGTDQPVPAAPGHTAQYISRVAANENGGLSVLVESPAAGGMKLAWGSTDGGLYGVHQFQGTFQGKAQSTWTPDGLGLADDGSVSYTALLVGGLDSVWKDSTPIAIEGNSAPLPRTTWGSMGSANITSGSADPYFIASVHSTAGGPVRDGLFLGTSPAPLVMTGDSIPGLAKPMALDSLYYEGVAVSAHGSHWAVTPGSKTGGSSVICDGQLHQIEGTPIVERSPLPGSFGPGSWGRLHSPRINEGGDLAFISSAADESILVRNGQITHRTGDLLGSQTIDRIYHLDMNELGELAFVAKMSTGLAVLVIEDRIVAYQGGSVDVTGDGVADPWATIESLGQGTSSGTPQIGEDRRTIFIARIDVFGTPDDPSDDERGVYSVIDDGKGPDTYCAPKTSSQGCTPTMRFFGTPTVTPGGIFNIATLGVHKDSVGLLAYSLAGKARTPFSGGTLCIAPPVRRTAPRTSNGSPTTPCSNALSMPFGQYIQGGSDPALSQGTEVFVQWFFRDAADPSGWGLSNAGHFVIRP